MTGAAGDTAFPSSGVPIPGTVTIADGGVAVGAVDAGSMCVGGVAVSPRPPMLPGGGIQPQLPAVVPKPSTPVPPLSGGTLLTLADAKTVAASDPDRDQVYLVDLTTNAVRATVRLQAGDEPGRAIQDPMGLLHVVLRRGGAIADIDPVTGTVSARRAVCGAPRGIVYDKTAKVLQVACAGGELVSLPAAGGAATRTVMLDRDLRDILIGPNGSLLVSTFRKAEVLVVGADVQRHVAAPRRARASVPTLMGMPQMRTPSVAWRMVSLDETTGSVAMLHQTGVTDMIDPAAGGYAGLKGCGGIVQAGISVLSLGADSPPVAGGMNNVSLAVDLAVSPDGQTVAVAVPGNAETMGHAQTIVQQSLPRR